MRTTAAASANGSQLRSRDPVEGTRWGLELTSEFYTRYQRNSPATPVLAICMDVFVAIRQDADGEPDLTESPSFMDNFGG